MPDDPYDIHQQITPVGLAAHQIAQGEHLDKDRSIISQSAGKDAAELAKAIIALTGETDTATVFDIYQDLRLRIFNDALVLAGAESVVERVEGGSPTNATPEARKPYARGGSAHRDGNDPGTLEIKAGKHQGKTVADAVAEDPEWAEWAVSNLKNEFLRSRIEAYVNAS